jgi:hypothetical protein
MNLFTKIAEEQNNITPTNIGLGATTLGGLGLTGHSVYKTHKHNSKIEELKNKKERALKHSRYYEKTLGIILYCNNFQGLGNCQD